MAAVNLGAPILDVTAGVRGALLLVLVRLERPVTRRQLAVVAGVAPGHASTVIGELVKSGLVNETAAGRSLMVALNRSHLAADSVVQLAGLRGALIRRLRERLATWPDLRGAWLFGSVARGDAHQDSDIDLLIVVDDLQSDDLHERITLLDADVRSWTGNQLQLVEHSTKSWRALARSNSLVVNIRRDGVPLLADSTVPLEPQS